MTWTYYTGCCDRLPEHCECETDGVPEPIEDEEPKRPNDWLVRAFMELREDMKRGGR